MQDIREELIEACAGCLGHQARRTARALSNRYNAELRPLGVNVSQFSLLASVACHPDSTLCAIADLMGLDDTTLTRNLRILERRGLVEVDGERGRAGKRAQLTERGWRIAQAALKEWRRLNSELRQRFSPDEHAIGQRYLKALEEAALMHRPVRESA